MSFFSNKENVDKLQQELDGALETEEQEQPAEIQEEQQSEVQKIKVGDAEYEPEELQRIVELGKLGREAEEKYNTKIDRVWPDFNKVRQENERLQKQIDLITEKASTSTSEVVDPNLQALKEAQEAARKVGLVLGDDLQNLIKQELQKDRQEAELMGELNKYEKEIDGKDGIRPKFNKIEVLQHMQETGMRSPIKAYRDMYEDQWLSWQMKQKEQVKKSGFTTLDKSSGDKKPQEVKVDKGNIRQLLGDMFF